MVITGRAVLVMLLGVIAVIAVPDSMTIVVWTVLVLLLIGVDLLLAASPRVITFSRRVPRSVRLSNPATSELTLTNEGRRTIRGVVRDAWQPSTGAQGNRHRLRIRGGEAARFNTGLMPTRRGIRKADRVTIRSFGPFGLAARQLSVDVPAELRVLPEFASRRHLPSRLAQLREIDGKSAVQLRGAGTEFDSLRDYVDGDDVRSIDWRATARRDAVVVRTWRPERDRRVHIVLDTSRTSAARLEDGTRLDASIEAALLLAALAGHAGDRVDLLAADRAVRAQTTAGTGTNQLAVLAEAFVPIDPSLTEANWPLIVRALSARLGARSLIVLLTALEPGSIEEGLLPVVGQLTANHVVVLASVTDPSAQALIADRRDVPSVYRAAAAERTALERTMAATLLAKRGVEIIEAPPLELAPKLADTYIRLKAAGRL